jgi:hypothetical protein
VLAGLGHDVHLVDASARLVDEARALNASLTAADRVADGRGRAEHSAAALTRSQTLSSSWGRCIT